MNKEQQVKVMETQLGNFDSLMEKMHKQTKCHECKLWKIWVIKPTLKGRRCVTKSEKEKRKAEISKFKFN